MADTKIYQQIEASADLYEPAIYELLSFYHGISNQADPLNGQFIPLTTVQPRSPKEVKIFAVGIIPPAHKAVSRLLDRSETVRSISTDYQTLINVFPDDGSSSTGDLPGETSGVGTSLPTPVGPTSSASSDFYDQYIAMCNRLGVQAEELARVIQTESSWDPSAQAVRNDRVVAKGLIQFTRATADGLRSTDGRQLDFDNIQNMTGVEQLPFVEAYYKGRSKGKNAAQLRAITFGGYNNPSTPLEPQGSLYSLNAEPPAYKNSDFQKKAYLQNRTLDGPPPAGAPVKGYITADDVAKRLKTVPKGILAKIQQAKANLGMSTEVATVKEPDPPDTSDDWQANGSDNANQAAKTQSLVSNKDLNQTNLGKRFQEAQKGLIRKLQAALETMANTPPLRLLVNPASFRVSSEKIISDGSWGRNGPIIEHWGENQDKIEGSGKVAAFYSMDINDANGPGLTRTARQFSTSYQNLLSLWLLYKNNGGVWFPDPISSSDSKAMNLSLVGSVYLYYDEILYVGSFDNFNLTESETTPFTLEYTFSFTVRAWYLLDHVDDSQYTYGLPKTPAVQTGVTAQEIGTGGNNAQVNSSVAPPNTTLTVPNPDDPLFGLTSGQIGDDLEGI